MNARTKRTLRSSPFFQTIAVRVGFFKMQSEAFNCLKIVNQLQLAAAANVGTVLQPKRTKKFFLWAMDALKPFYRQKQRKKM